MTASARSPTPSIADPTERRTDNGKHPTFEGGFLRYWQYSWSCVAGCRQVYTHSLRLHSSLLRSFRGALGLKLGIITNILPEMTDDVVRQLVAAAGLLRFLDDGAIVTNRDAGVRKPNVKTYQ